MSKYQDRIDEIEREILHAKGLRDGQEDGDPEYREFQQQAKSWTRLWTAYNAAKPRLEEIDQRERELTSRTRGIDRKWSSRESRVDTAGKIALAAGALLAALAWFTPMGFGTWALAVLLLAGGSAGARLLIGWIRQRSSEEQSEYQAELAALRGEYRRLHPESGTVTASATVEDEGDGWGRNLRAV